MDEYYTIVAGDAPTLIAQKVGIPYSQLKALNPEIETKCFVGQQVLVNRSKPYLSVRVTREEQYDETIPYSTVNVQDPTKYKGQSTVLVNGENGTAHVNAKVSIVDGIEESRTITSRQITKILLIKKYQLVQNRPAQTHKQSQQQAAKCSGLLVEDITIFQTTSGVTHIEVLTLHQMVFTYQSMLLKMVQ